MNKKKILNINLGCGTHIMKGPGWLNVDNFELSKEKSFLKADIRNLDIIENESVDYIICDQVLEHMAMADVPVVLFNIKRILKKGGRAVIIVPDFEDAARQWLSQNFNVGYDPMKYHWFSEVVYGNQAHEGEFHKTPMSARYLDYNLSAVGLGRHEILFWPANGAIPKFPGMRPYSEGAKLRNAQLTCDIVKE